MTNTTIYNTEDIPVVLYVLTLLPFIILIMYLITLCHRRRTKQKNVVMPNDDDYDEDI